MSEGYQFRDKPQPFTAAEKFYVSDLVGPALIEAAIVVNKKNSAEPIRVKLLTDLKSKSDGAVLGVMIQILEHADWSDKENVEKFRVEYTKFKSTHHISR